MVKTGLSRRAWLSLAAAALAGTIALTGCTLGEEQVEHAPTPSPESVPFATASPPASQPTVEPAATLVPLTPTAVRPTPFVTPAVTPPPTNPPEPTAEPDDDSSGAGPPHVEPPPPATLVTASGEQISGVYNYCWGGLCVDMLGVMVPAEAVIARADETLTFKLAIEPTQLVLLAWTLDRGSIVKEYEGFFAWRGQGETDLRYELPAQPSLQFTPDFAPGRYVIVLSVRTSDGDVGYGFLVEVVP